jgi:hypothetical protein
LAATISALMDDGRTCGGCGHPVRDPDSGRWAIPVDARQSMLANGVSSLAYRCACGCTFFEDQAYAVRVAEPAMRVGACRLCGRVVMLHETTDAPRAGDGKVVQIPGWGLVCTAHHGVVEFFVTMVGGA